MKNEARMGQLQEMYLQLRLRDATPEEVTEDELLERFQVARSQLQQRPKSVTFRQIVVRALPSEELKEAALAEAEGLLDRINTGEDFAELASEHSDDPGSAAQGGDLGWFRRGRMMREFEDAAFSLIDGQVSPIVETMYGYHIIKVEQSRMGERRARHILITPERTEADVERARALVEDALEQVRAGESIAQVAEGLGEYLDPDAPDSLTIPFEQIGELPPAYAELRNAQTGDHLGPLQFEAGPGDARFVALEVVEVREAGAYTFEDLRDRIASQLQQEKQRQRLLEGLRAETYIEVRR
jgi:peptidyl-prolyl cis-trans isomerase SurA